ncbi:hypothetical protein ACV07N_14850 [Roseivirga echinicomitans]
MKLKSTILLCLIVTFVNAQQPDLKRAPINPNPLEGYKYVLPKDVNTKAAYFMGRFYNEKGEMLHEAGLPYTVFATTEEATAKKLYGVHDVYDDRGNLTQHSIFYGSNKTAINFEYDPKNNLIKRTTNSTIDEYGYDRQNRLTNHKVINTYNGESLTEVISYKYNADITTISKTTVDASGTIQESVHTYKNGLLVSEDFGPTFKNEYTYLYDHKGNWIERNYASGGNRDRRNIVYPEDLVPSQIKVRETSQRIGYPAPVLTANGVEMTVNSFKSEANYFAYIPITNTYYYAANYYSKTQTIGTETDVEVLPLKDSLVASKVAGTNYQFSQNGLLLPDIVKLPTSDFNLYYDPNGSRYFQVIEDPSNAYGLGEITEYKTNYLGYNNLEARRSHFYNKGKEDFLAGASPGQLENGDLLIYINGTPTFVAKMNVTTSDMTIYMVSDYKGEKIKP